MRLFGCGWWGARCVSRLSPQTKASMTAPRPSGRLPSSRSRSTPSSPIPSATSSINATRRRVDPRPRFPRLPRPLWSSPSRPVPKSPMNLSLRPGETVWTEPCRPTSGRTTSMPCRWRQGAVRRSWRSRMVTNTMVRPTACRWRGIRRGRTPGPAVGSSADGCTARPRLRLVARRQRCRPRLRDGGSALQIDPRAATAMTARATKPVAR